MVRVVKDKYETIEIHSLIPQHKTQHPDDVADVIISLAIPLNHGDLATAACIKGIKEFFLDKVGDGQYPDDLKQMFEKAESILQQLPAAKSSLVL